MIIFLETGYEHYTNDIAAPSILSLGRATVYFLQQILVSSPSSFFSPFQSWLWQGSPEGKLLIID
jgi:hypothetical protein